MTATAVRQTLKLEGLEPVRWWQRRRWRLLDDYTFVLEPEGLRLVVPAGFVFDGASVPRLLTWCVSPVDVLLVPALFHDYGCVHDHLWVRNAAGEVERIWEGMGRKHWDDLMLVIGNQYNGLYTVNRLVWVALRAYAHAKGFA